MGFQTGGKAERETELYDRQLYFIFVTFFGHNIKETKSLYMALAHQDCNTSYKAAWCNLFFIEDMKKPQQAGCRARC